MPTYEFVCKDCNSTFTVVQPIWARHKGGKCPECGSENTQRVISRFNPGSGSDLSGGGWSGPFC